MNAFLVWRLLLKKRPFYSAMVISHLNKANKDTNHIVCTDLSSSYLAVGYCLLNISRFEAFCTALASCNVHE